MREILDGLLQRYYNLEDFASTLTEPQRNALFRAWIKHLGSLTGPIQQQGVQQLLGQILEVPYKWIAETDSQLEAMGAPGWMLEERKAEEEAMGAGKEAWAMVDDYHSELEG